MELVAEPSVLFLDEPTSGLDSSTSFEVCSNLRNIAEQQGLTVGAVIHSPSPATFKQFHDFMLLGKGGHVVYIGPREEAVSYFQMIGFTIPDDESPSDYFMDVVTGKVANEFDPAFVPTDLFKYWENRSNINDMFKNYRRMTPEHAVKMKCRHLISRGPEDDTVTPKKALARNTMSNYYGWGEYLASGLSAMFTEWKAFFIDVGEELYSFCFTCAFALLSRSDPVRDVQPFHMQLWFLTKRAFLQVYKNAAGLLSEMLLHFAAGIFISIAVQKFDYVGTLFFI